MRLAAQTIPGFRSCHVVWEYVSASDESSKWIGKDQALIPTPGRFANRPYVDAGFVSRHRSLAPPYPFWIPVFAGKTSSGGAGVSTRGAFSYQLFLPAGAGTPREENWLPCWNHLGASHAAHHHPSGFQPSRE